MLPIYKDRIVITPNALTQVSLDDVHKFNLPGQLVFPDEDLPLIFGDANGRFLGTSIAKVRVQNLNYIEEPDHSIRTTGEYRVVAVYYPAGTVDAQDLGSYLKNPIHNPPKKKVLNNHQPNNS
jgi:hypothetical protein